MLYLVIARLKHAVSSALPGSCSRRCLVGLMLYCCLAANSAAQTLTPPNATLLAAEGDAVSQVFFVTTGDTILTDVYLCIPECSGDDQGDDVGPVIVSGSDSAETQLGIWEINDECIADDSTLACQVTITYYPTAPGSSSAQLQVVLTNTLRNIVLDSFLTGVLEERSVPGLNENQSEIGRALDTACEALDAMASEEVELSAEQEDLQRTCRTLEGQLESGTLAGALNRLLPEELFTLGESAVETTDLQVTNVFTRLQALQSGRAEAFDLSGLQIRYRGQRIPGYVLDLAQDSLYAGGAASSDTQGFSTRFGFFVNGLLSSGEANSGENQKSSDFTTHGLTIGSDYRMSSNTVLGAAVGLSRSESDFIDDDDAIDSDGMNISLFGTWYEEGVAYADAVLDVGQHDYSIRRRINLPGAPSRFASGETESDAIALSFGTGRTFRRDAWEFAPYVRVSLAQAKVADYAESTPDIGDSAGIGSVLQIDSHRVRSTTLILGGRASVSVSTRRAVILPQLHIEAEFENEKQKDPIKARFRHDPTSTVFRVEGNERDAAYVNVGIGARVVFPRRRSGYLFYESRTAHDLLTQHSLKLGIRMDF